MVGRGLLSGMTLLPEADGKAIWSRWHEFRQEARRNAQSIDEFGAIEQELYDLDTAGITGRDNPETYRGEQVGPDPPYRESDLRDLPWTR